MNPKNLITVISIMLITLAISCNESDSPYTNGNENGNGSGYENGENPNKYGTTGTVIGEYLDVINWRSFLVLVDMEYPIGETFEYIRVRYHCVRLLEEGTYQNVIQVQSFLPIQEVVNKRISFSYRPFNHNCREDRALFAIGTGGPAPGRCIPPNLPLFVITDYQIIE